MAQDECKSFKKYQACFKPRCDCLACRDKYIEKLEEDIEDLYLDIASMEIPNE
jgi:hypothetical protein